MTSAPIAPQRRHTLLFLDEIRSMSPVFLDTEVDMTAVLAHRDAARAAGRRYSLVSYLLYAAGRVLTEHPAANAAIRGRLRPRVARYPEVTAKLALDKTVAGQRVVLSALVPDVGTAGLDDIQDRVDHFRDGDPETMPEFAGTRAVHRLPWPVRGAAFRSAARPLAKRPRTLGTVAVTSLGHRPVDGFYSVGGTTITLGMGRITDRPVVRDGAVTVAPVLRLSLTFDHRVIDGAEAADVLADLVAVLETFDAEPQPVTEGDGAMSDVAELKQFVVVHARGQNIPDYQRVLDRIRTDATGPGSWVYEWSRAAAGHELTGQAAVASRCYALARFPYVNGPSRQEAQDRCVAAFDRWRAASAPQVESLKFDVDGETVRCWAVGLSTRQPRPVVVVTGGIVTVKEQWAAALSVYQRFGFAAVALELPGVGENRLRYDEAAWRMYPALLDAIADRADVSRAYAMALSFSGHLALRAAAEDKRIRGVITTGAPIREFFVDRDWQRDVPEITMDTLSAMAGVSRTELPAVLPERALTAAQLAALDIPVAYVVSRRDEIIPPGDPAFLRAHLRNLSLLEHDDVHGAPAHVEETQLWCVRSLLRMHGVGGPKAAIVDVLWRLARRRAARGARPAAS